MANALQSFRVSKQQPSLKGFTVETGQPSPNESTDADQQAVISAYDYLAGKNPALNDLVSRMDLMEVGNPQLVPVEKPAQTEKPAPPMPISPAARERLQGVANRSLSEGISYSYEEVLSRIMEATDVEESRAQNGLALMLSESIVSQTHAGTYYLSGTVPF